MKKNKKIDEISNSKLKDEIKEMFLKIQEAWNNNSEKDLLHLESSLLYERDAATMRMYTSMGLKEVRKCVVINYVKPAEYFEFGSKQILKVRIKASMEKYVYNPMTEEVVSGIREYKETKIHILTLIKEKNKTGHTKTKCIGCGADVNVMSSGKCEYCGTLFYTKEYDWVVANIEEIPYERKKY